MKRKLATAITLAAVLLGAMPLLSTATESASSPADAQRLQWWRDARFGMFIHWGPVSLKGTEIGWSRGDQVPVEEYDNLYRRFNPTNFNAREWARLAKAAGMKYVVLTTKHHDGFCLWDTKLTDYNIMNTPFHRDVTRELAAACRKEGIVFCTYHSICDWRHPDYPLGSPGGKSQKPDANIEHYSRYLKGQLAELLQNYGPLGVLWFDGEWEQPWTTERGTDLYAYVKSIQPSLIVNNRVSKARKGMEGVSAAGEFSGDYDTPEQTIGKFQDQRPWESCITICQQWAWKPEDKMKSLEECLQTLVMCAGGDGNLLLNVGPMPDGRIEARQAERLKEMGAWLRKYGEAIYGTRGGPWKPTNNFASTRRGNTVYLHMLHSQGEQLTLRNLPAKVRAATVLSGGKATVTQDGDRLLISVPARYRDAMDTIVRLRLDRSAMEIAPLSVGD